MEDKIFFIEPLFERVEEYGKTSLELIKLKALNKTTEVLSTGVSRGLVIIVLFIFINFASIGAALWLGGLLGKLYYGFFCVAGFYGIIGIVLFVFMHKWIKKCVSDSIVLQMFN
jgi:hypothetical protein